MVSPLHYQKNIILVRRTCVKTLKKVSATVHHKANIYLPLKTSIFLPSTNTFKIKVFVSVFVCKSFYNTIDSRQGPRKSSWFSSAILRDNFLWLPSVLVCVNTDHPELIINSSFSEQILNKCKCGEELQTQDTDLELDQWIWSRPSLRSRRRIPDKVVSFLPQPASPAPERCCGR